MNISFIGFGNMAKAIAQGLLRDKTIGIRAASPSLPMAINENGIKTYPDNLAVLPGADIIIIAVKPAKIHAVLKQISAQCPNHCLIISVASGISLAQIAKSIPHLASVRAMPNIAASIGLSATPLIANNQVTTQQKQWTESIFNAIGMSIWTEQETDMDAFTALSGSGPAYLFQMMEAMIKAGVALGLSEAIAKSFTIQTFRGAVSLASDSSHRICELRHTVTSPGGTTAAALAVFNDRGFDEIIVAAMKAAYARAQELGALQ